ncbi:hypothetical protein H072_3600 [Dactylellina haptotyla CBS 200.50]|uniref:HNH domain-containing protein n=1 Tax=Dactylellina haptotyla (strain CBS 200.50) TaxID=1284197 RepID=S8C3Y1_DACHA|nr:hypothetical protein H072_3600 [Dactylellina haptotyla CBS 200.50]
MSGFDHRSYYEMLKDSMSVTLVKAVLNKELAESKETRLKVSRNGGELDAKEEAEELAEFIEFLATDLFQYLPKDLTDINYDMKLADETGRVGSIEMAEEFLDNLPATYVDAIVEAKLLGDAEDVKRMTTTVLEDYLAATTAPPQRWSETRPLECELCNREVRLTYHHLIPRSTHARVLKKKIHPEYMLNRVAWLCRLCHSFVHHCEENMELAKNWYTIELLEGRDDVQRWITYISKRPGRTRVK